MCAISGIGQNETEDAIISFANEEFKTMYRAAKRQQTQKISNKRHKSVTGAKPIRKRTSEQRCGKMAMQKRLILSLFTIYEIITVLFLVSFLFSFFCILFKPTNKSYNILVDFMQSQLATVAHKHELPIVQLFICLLNWKTTNKPME